MSKAFSFFQSSLTGITVDGSGNPVHFPDYVEFFTGAFKTTASETNFTTDIQVHSNEFRVSFSGEAETANAHIVGNAFSIYGNLYPLYKESGYYAIAITGEVVDPGLDKAYNAVAMSGIVTGSLKDDGYIQTIFFALATGCLKDTEDFTLRFSGFVTGCPKDTSSYSASLTSGNFTAWYPDETIISFAMTGLSLTAAGQLRSGEIADVAGIGFFHVGMKIGI